MDTLAPPSSLSRSAASPGLDVFQYDDKIVRQFVLATTLWGFIGMTVGALIALQLPFWQANLGPYLTFGRLRPLHTNAVIFAFAGNAIFAGIYYSTQRLCKARMFSDVMSKIHFWGWQAIIVAAAITLPLGITHGEGVRRTRMAHRHRHRGGVGRLRGQLLLDAQEAPRAAPLRGALVLHRHHHHRGDAAHRQLPGDAGVALPQLPDLRRRAGRARAVVVRPQRRRVLPDDAVPGPDVLLPAEGGGAARVLLPPLHRPLLVPRLHLHLGRAAPPATTPPCRSGRPRWAWCFP